MRQIFYLFTLVFACALQAKAAPKPNILFIMVDDLGKEWVSSYGADNIQTPHIDKLAKGGMKFHNAWSMPQCTPTRTTLLTGQYPWRTGWVNHWDVPRWGVGYFDWAKYTTFARVMKDAGYRTAIAGKWQINDFRLEPKVLEKHGFDDWCMWTGYEAQNKPSGERYWDAYIHTRKGSRTYKDKFGPDIYCDFLVDFIRANKTKPMMLYFPMALTHGPLVHTPDELKVTEKMAKHRAMVRYTDKLVGRLVKAVDDAGIRENTIIIFTTDNGTGGGQRGTIKGVRPTGGKASNYEGGVCEPFIVNCPGTVPSGVETDALTDFSDLLPTFAELGDAPLPKGVTLDGKSFAPLLLGKAKDSPREWILAMGHGAGQLDEKGVRGRDDYMDRVLRDKRYKVWLDNAPKITRLYDLKTDPMEKKNLIESRKLEHVVALNKFKEIVDSQPKIDARPQYRPRKANAWDRKPKESLKPKRGNRKNQKEKNRSNQNK